MRKSGCHRCGGALVNLGGLIRCQDCGHGKGSQRPWGHGSLNREEWLNSTDENIVRNFTHDGYSQSGRRLPLDAVDDKLCAGPVSLAFDVVRLGRVNRRRDRLFRNGPFTSQMLLFGVLVAGLVLLD